MAYPYDANLIATGMTERVFVVPEVTFGTAVAPTADDGVLVIATPRIEQFVPLIDDAQRRNTHSYGDPIRGKLDVGTWELQCYVKPSGALGTAPECGPLLKALFGVETVTSSTSVVYTFKPAGGAMPTLTIWRGNNIMAQRAAGCVVKRGEFRLLSDPSSDGSVLQATFSGECVSMIQATRDQLASNTTGSASVMVVTDGQKFQVGMRVQIDDAGTIDDNSGAGYPITGISTNTLTVTGTVAAHTASANTVVEPWLPSTVTEVGVAVHSGIGSATLGGDSVYLTEETVTVENEVMIPVNIRGSSEYPGARQVRATKRRVGREASMYYVPGAGSGNAWYRHLNVSGVAFNSQVNNRSGVDAVKFLSPRAFLEGPQIEGDEAQTLRCAMRTAWTSAYDTELSLSFSAP